MLQSLASKLEEHLLDVSSSPIGDCAGLSPCAIRWDSHASCQSRSSLIDGRSRDAACMSPPQRHDRPPEAAQSHMDRTTVTRRCMYPTREQSEPATLRLLRLNHGGPCGRGHQALQWAMEDSSSCAAMHGQL